MVRKVLIYGLFCVVVAAGAVAYLAGIHPDELAGSPPQPAVVKASTIPRPAFAEKSLATLEKSIEAKITADVPAITELQASRRWVKELDPLIPDGKESVVWKEAFEEHVAYRKRIVEDYRRGTADPQAAREPAAKFLENYSHAAAWQRGDWKAIREEGDAAIGAGSTDPIIVAYHTRSKHNLQELPPAEAFELYRKLKEKLGQGAYPPPILGLLLHAWIADLSRTLNHPEAPYHAMRQIAFAEAAKFLAGESGSTNPAVLQSLVQNALRFDNNSAEQRLELFQACLAEPKIDPYIVHMIGGEYYRQLAWDRRGAGYADTVSPDGWKQFNELMPRAARHFRRAWFLHPELPFAAERMIMVSTAGGDESWSPEDWFHASIRAQFDYHEAYSDYMFVMMPRWRGTHQEVADIALACLATGRWDTQVPNEVQTAVNLIARDYRSEELIGKIPLVESLAAAYIDAFAAAKERGEAKPDDSADTLAMMASILVQAGDFTRARKAFDVSPEANDWWWNIDRGVGYRYSMGLSYAITGPAKEEIRDIHTFLTKEAVEVQTVEEVEAMQKRLADAQAKDQEPKAAGYYDIAGRMLGQLRAYAAGEWVDLTFDRHMTLWTARAAGYDMIDSRTLRLTGNAQAVMQMKPLVRFAPPYMVEAEIKRVSSVSGEAMPGIIIGASRVRTQNQKVRPQLLASGGKIMAYFDYLQRDGKPAASDFNPDPVPEDGFLHLGVRRYPGETQMFAMRGRFLADRNNEPVNDYLAFGDVDRAPVTGEAIFRNLRIRRAPPKIPGLHSERPDSLPGYQQAVDYYPECPEARRLLAAALAAQGQPAQALEHVAKAKSVYPKISDINRVEGVARCALGEFQAALDCFRRESNSFSFATWPRLHEAWILATAPDEKLRDGKAAQTLLEAIRPQLGGDAAAWSFLATEAVVAAENGQFEQAKELARQAEDMTDTEARRAVAQRVRAAIEEGRPYRMPPTGELPPLPAGPKKVKNTEPEKKSDESEARDCASARRINIGLPVAVATST